MFFRLCSLQLAAVGLLACSPAPAPAQTAGSSPFADLYDDRTLDYWHRRYHPNLRYNFDTLIIGSLSPDERAGVRGLVFDVPVRHEGDPLTWFARPGSQPLITVSTASVRFLDDIAIAFAWLETNGYSVESISYYASVLKYRPLGQLPSGTHPAPLDALGIPSDALSDGTVDEDSQKLLKSAVVFLLAHELGHVVHGHRLDVPAADRQRQEMEADRFAVTTFRRIGTAPIGAVPLFFLSTYLGKHRADFDSDAAWTAHLRTSATHPLSSARLRALASEFRHRPQEFVHAEPRPEAALRGLGVLPARLDSIAALLDDPLLVRHARIVGTQIPLRELGPRRPGRSWIPPDIR